MFAFAVLAAAQEPPAIRVTTRMVQVSVVVRDQRGNPVAGLTRDDFELSDNGQPQEIRWFAVDTGERQPVAGAPGSFTNRGGAASYVSSVIVLDQLNCRYEDEAYGRSQLLRFLAEAEPGHKMALVSLSSELRILHDFTMDTAAVRRALERYRPKRGIAAAAFRPLDGGPAFRKIDAMTEGAKARERAAMTSAAAGALAAYLARVPGRKNLIWLSSAFPGSLAARARLDDVAIYPVDLRGLRAPSEAEIKGDTLDQPLFDGVYYSAQALAERTGGVAFTLTNDLRLAIRTAHEDARGAYLLGYYPAHGEWDGRYRTIRVGVHREGARARHRRGYFALPEGPARTKSGDSRLMEAAQAPGDEAGIPIDATLRRAGGAVSLALTIGAGRLAFRPDGGRMSGSLQILVVAVREDGFVFPAGGYTLTMDLAHERYDELLEKGIPLSARLRPPRGASKLRVVVREEGGGATGSLTIPLDGVASR